VPEIFASVDNSQGEAPPLEQWTTSTAHSMLYGTMQSRFGTITRFLSDEYDDFG